MSRIVAIVGRPNVGKSTLFNRLIGERKAIVDDLSGVTRDRHYGECEWNGETFNVIDTGGYVSDSKDIFEAAIRDQVKIAIEESNLLLFMVDVTTDVTDLDSQFASILRKSKKPVIVVVNKVDTHDKINQKRYLLHSNKRKYNNIRSNKRRRTICFNTKSISKKQLQR
jgi:GTP-binding protein